MFNKTREWFNKFKNIIINNVKKLAQKLKAKFFVFKTKRNKFLGYKNNQENGIINPVTGHVAMKWKYFDNMNSVSVLIADKKSRIASNQVINKQTTTPVTESYDPFNKYVQEAEKFLNKLFESIEDEFPDLVADVANRNKEDVLASKTDYNKALEEIPPDSMKNVNNKDIVEILDVLFGLIEKNPKYNRTKGNQTSGLIPSMFLFGPPGVNKSNIVEQYAKENGIKVYKIQLASVYEDLLSGVPVVEEKNLGKELVMKMPDLFPPKDYPGKVIVFFDEFNIKEAQMKLAMNYFLNGAISSNYSLPPKTIVIGAGNVGGDIDDVKVIELDFAELTRPTFVVLKTYNWMEVAEYGKQLISVSVKEDNKNITYKVHRFPIMFYAQLVHRSLNAGRADWKWPTASIKFNWSKSDLDESEIPKAFNPRVYVKIAEMIRDYAVDIWNGNAIIPKLGREVNVEDITNKAFGGAHSKEWFKKEYKKRGYESPLDFFINFFAGSKQGIQSIRLLYPFENEKDFIRDFVEKGEKEYNIMTRITKSKDFIIYQFYGKYTLELDKIMQQKGVEELSKQDKQAVQTQLFETYGIKPQDMKKYVSVYVPSEFEILIKNPGLINSKLKLLSKKEKAQYDEDISDSLKKDSKKYLGAIIAFNLDYFLNITNATEEHVSALLNGVEAVLGKISDQLKNGKDKNNIIIAYTFIDVLKNIDDNIGKIASNLIKQEGLDIYKSLKEKFENTDDTNKKKLINAIIKYSKSTTIIQYDKKTNKIFKIAQFKPLNSNSKYVALLVNTTINLPELVKPIKKKIKTEETEFFNTILKIYENYEELQQYLEV